MFNYNKFVKSISEGVVVDGDIDIDNMIDDIYKDFKKSKIPVNTIDIIEAVELEIGEELDDRDYEELYFKITGERISLDSDKIPYLYGEEKYIVN